ncbi:hypothetical protein [Atrimonas thermophila]|uniref:hypothetical protein n=1 Tax=Atrimonas thermophila TaxID=3064161 RepID=UPI00399D4DB3
MANPGDFHDYCARCGKLVYYEDMYCLADSWYCKECYEAIVNAREEPAKVIWLEDDGHCD